MTTAHKSRRQQFLAETLAGNPPRYVARVRHINARGYEVDGQDYHFNVPGDMINMAPGYVIVRGKDGRLIVAKLLEILPVSEYPNATEWLVAPVRQPDIKRYVAAEEEFFKRGVLRNEVGKKKVELRELGEEIKQICEKWDAAHARIGRDVVTRGVANGNDVRTARKLDEDHKEATSRKWALVVEIQKLEAKL